MRTNLNPSRKLVFLLWVVLFGAPLASLSAQQAAPAQEAAAAREESIKVLRVRSEDASQIAELLQSYEVSVRRSDRLGLITIAGRPENVARAEQAVREIEKLTMRSPASMAQDVELTVHFLGIVLEDSALPPGPLREVVAELKKTFPFPGYKLLETVVLRTRVGEGSAVNGLLPEILEEGTPPTTYSFESRVSTIEPRQNTQLIRLDRLRASIRLPIPQGTNFTFQDLGISTGLEVPDGKTVVVGKAGSVGESQGYLLVLTAKVVR